MISTEDYQDWLLDSRRDAHRVILVEIEHQDGVIRLASRDYLSDEHLPYDDWIIDEPSLEESLNSFNAVGFLDAVNPDTSINWLGYRFRGFKFTMCHGDMTWARSKFRVVVNALNEGVQYLGGRRYRFETVDAGREYQRSLSNESFTIGQVDTGLQTFSSERNIKEMLALSGLPSATYTNVDTVNRTFIQRIDVSPSNTLESLIRRVLDGIGGYMRVNQNSKLDIFVPDTSKTVLTLTEDDLVRGGITPIRTIPAYKRVAIERYDGVVTVADTGADTGDLEEEYYLKTYLTRQEDVEIRLEELRVYFSVPHDVYNVAVRDVADLIQKGDYIRIEDSELTSNVVVEFITRKPQSEFNSIEVTADAVLDPVVVDDDVQGGEDPNEDEVVDEDLPIDPEDPDEPEDQAEDPEVFPNEYYGVEINEAFQSKWGANGEVFTVHTAGSVAYFGGEFTQIINSETSVSRGALNFGAVDRYTGEPVDFTPQFDNKVFAIEHKGSTLYVAGNFRNVNGQARNRVCAFDLTTGNLLSWNPDLPNNAMRDIAISDTHVYLAGLFTSVGGHGSDSVARVDIVTGDVDTGFTVAIDDSGETKALKYYADTDDLWMAGTFSRVHNTARRGAARVDGTTGALLSSESARNEVIDLAGDDDRVYLAGGGPGGYGQSMDRRTGVVVWEFLSKATAANPKGGGNVQGVEVLQHPDNPYVYFGGHNQAITDYSGPNGDEVEHDQANRMFRVFKTTGYVDTSWVPYVNGIRSVNAVEVRPDGVYIGGDFTKVGTEGTGNNNDDKNRFAYFLGNPAGANVGADTIDNDVTAGDDPVAGGGAEGVVTKQAVAYGGGTTQCFTESNNGLHRVEGTDVGGIRIYDFVAGRWQHRPTTGHDADRKVAGVLILDDGTVYAVVGNGLSSGRIVKYTPAGIPSIVATGLHILANNKSAGDSGSRTRPVGNMMHLDPVTNLLSVLTESGYYRRNLNNNTGFIVALNGKSCRGFARKDGSLIYAATELYACTQTEGLVKLTNLTGNVDEESIAKGTVPRLEDAAFTKDGDIIAACHTHGVYRFDLSAKTATDITPSGSATGANGAAVRWSGVDVHHGKDRALLVMVNPRSADSWLYRSSGSADSVGQNGWEAISHTYITLRDGVGYVSPENRLIGGSASGGDDLTGSWVVSFIRSDTTGNTVKICGTLTTSITFNALTSNPEDVVYRDDERGSSLLSCVDVLLRNSGPLVTTLADHNTVVADDLATAVTDEITRVSVSNLGGALNIAEVGDVVVVCAVEESDEPNEHHSWYFYDGPGAAIVWSSTGWDSYDWNAAITAHNSANGTTLAALAENAPRPTAVCGYDAGSNVYRFLGMADGVGMVYQDYDTVAGTWANPVISTGGPDNTADATSKSINTPRGIACSSDGSLVLYVNQQTGEVYRSLDFGASVQKIATGTNGQAIASSPATRQGYLRYSESGDYAVVSSGEDDLYLIKNAKTDTDPEVIRISSNGNGPIAIDPLTDDVYVHIQSGGYVQLLKFTDMVNATSLSDGVNVAEIDYARNMGDQANQLYAAYEGGELYIITLFQGGGVTITEGL